MATQSLVSSREVVHNFSAVAARVAAGEELTVTRYGKPVMKLVQVPALEMSKQEREALIEKALSMRLTGPMDKKSDRRHVYDA